MRRKLVFGVALATAALTVSAGAVTVSSADLLNDTTQNLNDTTGGLTGGGGGGGGGVNLPGGGSVNLPGGGGGGSVNLPGGGGSVNVPTTPSPTPAPPPPTGGGGGGGNGGGSYGGSTGATGPGGPAGSGGSSGGGGGGGSNGGGTQAHPRRNLNPMKPPPSPPRKPNGVPTKFNPSLTVAKVGPAPLGVPSFIIGQFEIPPFLLPIYQACGSQYGIPWEVLAGINKIETAFGTNLNVSTAGAVGWMQFIPSTWKAYGVDANGDGHADPYNPVDAICAAARYLKAAGGDTNIRKGIFAYNHATWYVDEVLLAARQYGNLPDGVVGSLTGLTVGDRFPVAANSRYADDISEHQVASRAKPGQGGTGNIADVVSGSPTRQGINIYSHDGAPVVAVNDGTIVKVGHNAKLGKFIVLEDGYGNKFTYAQLGDIQKTYRVPAPQRNLSASDFKLVTPSKDQAPSKPATRGKPAAAKPAKPAPMPPNAPRDASRTPSSKRDSSSTHRGPRNTQNLRPRIFAFPNRPHNAGLSDLTGQFSDMLSKRFPGFPNVKSAVSDGLDGGSSAHQPLRKGSSVTAGTVLGHIAKTDSLAPHLNFSIQPAGKGAPKIDPKPILDGWKLLEATAIYRAAGQSPFTKSAQSSDTSPSSVIQDLLTPKVQLERKVLADPRLSIYACGRNDIRTNQVDRRVLATMEYLADNGYKLTITTLKCGRGGKPSSSGRTLAVSANPGGGEVMDISKIDGVPVAGHEGPGTLANSAMKSVLKLQGVMQPEQVISNQNLPGPISFTSKNHLDTLQIGFRPLFGAGYQYPFPNCVEGRVDMGLDFTGTGPILAIGNAQILQTGAPGWPQGGGVLYRLLDGPRAGQVIYVYEGVRPTVHPGQQVLAGQQIASFTPGSIEIGFADSAGNALAHNVYSEGMVTKWGLRMKAFLHSLGGSTNMKHQFTASLDPRQWSKLSTQLGKIQNPQVPKSSSKP